MSASTNDDKHSPYVGRWTGTSATQPFNDFTIIDISYQDGSYRLGRHDRRSSTPLEGQMTFLSEDIFTATVPTWLGTQVSMHGAFHPFTVPVLTLKIRNDGLTGLETIDVVLKQDASEDEKYQVSQVEGVSAGHLPSNPSFPSTAGPEALNMTKQQLDAAIRHITTPPSTHPENRVHGLLILKDGHRIHESYHWGLTPQTPHIVASLTKSIISLLTGIAYDQHLLTLDDVLSTAFPTLTSSWAADPPIRVRHALSMTTGTTFGNRETGRLLTSPCIEEMILASPRNHGAPGEKWHYDNSLPCLLSLYIERRSGVGIAEFARRHLFSPLGITGHTWTPMRQRSVDGSAFVLPSGGLHLTLSDMGRIGEMMVGKGVYRGTRVVSEEYIELATRRQTREGDYPYGFFFHVNEAGRHVKGEESGDAYMAVGSGGQVIWVAPRQRLVFVALGSSWGDIGETPSVVRAFAETVLAGLE